MEVDDEVHCLFPLDPSDIGQDRSKLRGDLTVAWLWLTMVFVRSLLISMSFLFHQKSLGAPTKVLIDRNITEPRTMCYIQVFSISYNYGISLLMLSDVCVCVKTPSHMVSILPNSLR